MKTYKKINRRGLATILNVVIIGGFMLGVMSVVYRASIRAMEGQKKVQLLMDYEAREQAFLRSVVTLTPKYAANTMIDGGTDSFKDLYEEARDWSDFVTARSGDLSALALPAGHVNGNIGDIVDTDGKGINLSDLIGDSDKGVTKGALSSLTGNNLPDAMSLRSSSSTTLTDSEAAPVISSDITYDSSSSSGDLRDYDKLDYPKIHFGYTRGTFVARQNWWQLDLHANKKNIGATGAGSATSSANDYILSLYEVPSQLPISSSAITNLGLIDGSTYDPNLISIDGSIYAKKAVIGASSAINNLATTGGVQFDGDASVGGTDVEQVNSGGTDLRDAAVEKSMSSAVDVYYPISRASDYARSMFLPINPGIEFFDRFASTPTSGTRKSKDHWFEYTRGCHQCAMELIVYEVDATSGEPTGFAFKFIGSNGFPQIQLVSKNSDTTNLQGLSENLYKSGTDAFYRTPEDWVESESYPFETLTSADGNPMIIVHIDRLLGWIEDKDGSVSFETNHSLLVNVDHISDSDLRPLWGDEAATEDIKDDNLAVGLSGCSDLTAFGKGFSFVSNFRLYILDNLNNVKNSGSGLAEYPPLSVFAPSVRFGNSNDANAKIVVDGQLGSLSQSSSGIDILDLKKGGADDADAASIEAELKAIEEINELPPVNVMNWLIVVQKK